MTLLRYLITIFFLVALSLQTAWGQPATFEAKATKSVAETVKTEENLKEQKVRSHQCLERIPCGLSIHRTAEYGRFIGSTRERASAKSPLAEEDPLLTSLGMCE